MLRVRTTIAALAVAGVITISAPTAGASVADAQSPKAWAAATCTALADWSSTLAKSLGKATATATGDATKARRALVKAYGAAAARSDRLAHQLAGGGAPSVSGGATVVSTLRKSIEKVAASLRTARNAVKAAPVTDTAAFQASLASATGVLQADLATAGLALSGVKAFGSPALRKAARASSACRKLSGA